MAQLTLRNYLQETEDAISAGRAEDALVNCQTILSYFPEALEAQRLLGEAYLAQGHLEDAQHAFDWVLTHDPENVIAYCNRALVSERLTDYDTALDCYQQAYELSRGNSQIRQKFNQLSAQVDQQGFMLSRAGLARLYMRGDLSTQAIQEWETVLTAAPDRLDARTGLLETYWRAGQYDRVESLASQILQDIPGCLKALLLLAYVTASRDTQQARELLQRAEALDPDGVMAQELFADVLASQPDDPFLKLLKKSPTTLNTALAAPGSLQVPVEEPVPALARSSGVDMLSPAHPVPSAPPGWGSGENWGSDTTLVKPRSEAAIPQYDSAADWSSQNTAGTNFAELLQEGSPRSDMPNLTPPGSEVTHIAPWNTAASAQAPQSDEAQAEPWQLLQDTLSGLGSSSASGSGQGDITPWQSLGAYDEAPEKDVWAGLADKQDAGFANSWAQPSQGENPPSPPAWLSMLTQSERQQMSEAMPPVSAQTPPAEQPVQPTQPTLAMPLTQSALPTQPTLPVPATQSASSTSVSAEPASPSLSSWSQEPVPEPPAPVSTQDEESFFGPAWLKSLGATSLDENGIMEPAEPLQAQNANIPAASFNETEWQEKTAEPQSWTAQDAERQSQPDTYNSWMTQAPEVQSQQDVERQSQPDTYNSWTTQAPEPQLQSATYDLWAQDPDPQPQPTYDSWQTQPSEEPETAARYDSWQPQAGSGSSAYEEWRQTDAEPQTAAVSDQSGNVEQNLLTTLEELEQKLRSRGFIPLEPNSLSSLAHNQERQPEALPSVDTPQYGAPQQEEQQAPTLSSALAELGNYVQQANAANTASTTPTPAAPEPARQADEPSWLQALSPASDTAPAYALAQEPSAPSPTWSAPAADPVFNPAQQSYRQSVNVPQEPPVTPPVRFDAAPEPVFGAQPAPAFTAKEQPQPLKVPPVQANPLLSGELETTMKRPAVRLQPMRQKPVAPREQPAPVSRGRANERTASKTEDTNSGYRERLVQGYQHQLLGDYDEAMQEYRIIIRNAPDLLGEVISNVRALLKLAPNYSAGYRVLGDAYMRQGEYLQAMEAYNKALTMAKKKN